MEVCQLVEQGMSLILVETNFILSNLTREKKRKETKEKDQRMMELFKQSKVFFHVVTVTQKFVRNSAFYLSWFGNLNVPFKTKIQKF